MDKAQSEELQSREVLVRLGEILDRLLVIQQDVERLLDAGDAEALERVMGQRDAVGAPLATLSSYVESHRELYADQQQALEALAARAAELSRADVVHLSRMRAMRDSAGAELKRLQSARSIQNAYASEGEVVPTLQDREA